MTDVMDIMALEHAEAARSEDDRRKVKWHVRQYRPAYFSGFENSVAHDVEYDAITSPDWFRSFEHDGFTKFVINAYGRELIISAYYADGGHWVAGFAVDVSTEFASNFRYAPPPGRDASKPVDPR